MAEKTPVAMSWSGGKDSALALHAILQSEQHEVVSLLTTISEEYNRISHHGVRAELLEQQAEAIGIPLDKVFLSKAVVSNAEYEEVIAAALAKYKEQGVDIVVYGDIFLEDLRVYREKQLADIEMKAIFPIWKRDTTELIGEFIEQGFRSVICCTVAEKLGESFCGRNIDRSFVADLSEGVDPCGENGEYHSFAYDGPIFKHPVAFECGETVKRDVRWFTDLLQVR